MSRARRIADRFGAAAETYGEAARVQRRIAEALARDILAEPIAARARVLELGCGGGLLTALVAPALDPDLWVASDIAPAMLGVLGRTVTHGAVARVAMDAEAPCMAPGFDLVCSSLTLQWLADPARALARWRALVRPGGILAFATLLEGSFGEWRAALKAAGAPQPQPSLPTLDALLSWAPGARAHTLSLTEPHASALDFLKSSRRAGVDAGLARALDAGIMRRAIRALDRLGPAATYHAAIVIVRA
ncbi:MAG TPA: methyltransferase domain-containing protein [Caulobacteraceae bacterium]|nr:methyltransferase domain-containing protein [Caulobacteraceae bacterium]